MTAEKNTDQWVWCFFFFYYKASTSLTYWPSDKSPYAWAEYFIYKAGWMYFRQEKYLNKTDMTDLESLYREGVGFVPIWAGFLRQMMRCSWVNWDNLSFQVCLCGGESPLYCGTKKTTTNIFLFFFFFSLSLSLISPSYLRTYKDVSLFSKDKLQGQLPRPQKKKKKGKVQHVLLLSFNL